MKTLTNEQVKKKKSFALASDCANYPRLIRCTYAAHCKTENVASHVCKGRQTEGCFGGYISTSGPVSCLLCSWAPDWLTSLFPKLILIYLLREATGPWKTQHSDHHRSSGAKAGILTLVATHAFPLL